MKVENDAIESHGCGLSDDADSSTYRRYDAKIRLPEDEVLDSYSGFFLDFLTTHTARAFPFKSRDLS
jgi:hypothetical protein